VFAAEGTFDGLKRLRTEDEVVLTIIPGDFWYYAKFHGSGPVPEGKTASPQEQRIRDAWRDINENIRLVLPLYQKMLHIFVKAEDKTIGKFQNLSDLFHKGARVSIGPAGSDSMLTCALLEQMMIGSPGGTSRRWRTHYSPTDEALRTMVGKGKEPPGSLDAVILYAETPERAEEELRRLVSVHSDLLDGVVPLSENQREAPLALLPFGEEADAIIDGNPDFRGYLPADLNTTEYGFIQAESAPVKTRSVVTCLVSHRKYTDDAGRESHKIGWVRHVVYRVLGKLDRYGLPGESSAGDQWKTTAQLLARINRGDDGLTWDTFGWPLHDDKLLREMLTAWRDTPRQDQSIDPDRL
jgi:hypothetical protein